MTLFLMVPLFFSLVSNNHRHSRFSYLIYTALLTALLPRGYAEGTFLWLLGLAAVSWLYPWGQATKVYIVQQLLLVLAFLARWPLNYPPVAVVGSALLSVPFAEALLNTSVLEKRYLRLAWLFLGAGLTLWGLWTALLAPWLFVTIAMHLYPRDNAPFNLLAYLSLLWCIAVRGAGALYWGVFFFIHLGAVIYLGRKAKRSLEPIPVVWQAIALYAGWVAVGIGLPVISRLWGAHQSVGVGFYTSGAVPAVGLTLWSLRHSLRRDGTAHSLAHFGVVLMLVGATANVLFASSQTVTLGLERLVADGAIPLLSLVCVFGAVMMLAGGLADVIESLRSGDKSRRRA